MITAACDAAPGRVYVKLHPLQDSAARQKVEAHCASLANAQLSAASVHDLIAASDTVISQNSAVGFEALMQKKPDHLRPQRLPPRHRRLPQCGGLAQGPGRRCRGFPQLPLCSVSSLVSAAPPAGAGHRGFRRPGLVPAAEPSAWRGSLILCLYSAPLAGGFVSGKRRGPLPRPQ
ncbi:capsular polysaccharide export protein, LipB/KpsS family, partial [Leisingera sp. ANG-Vp]|uniref:capsular polysaccharide export protein, LipB/KpsS family n=1 Tax=Leisingera sp. ANG-Vp TaxID=1577896 RepID=UPI00406CBCD7